MLTNCINIINVNWSKHFSPTNALLLLFEWHLLAHILTMKCHLVFRDHVRVSNSKPTYQLMPAWAHLSRSVSAWNHGGAFSILMLRNLPAIVMKVASKPSLWGLICKTLRMSAMKSGAAACSEREDFSPVRVYRLWSNHQRNESPLFSSNESMRVRLPLHTKSIIRVACRRLLKCALPLYLLGLSNGGGEGAFRHFLLILGYSSFLLFQTGILQSVWDSKEASNRQS